MPTKSKPFKELTTCPNCGANLVGDLIPEKDRWLFGNATNFNRTIGVYDVHKDCTVRWKCPDCGYEWNGDELT